MTTPPAVGFLEESANVRSMSRALAACSMAGLLALTGAVVVVALRGGEEAPGVIAALAGYATPLAAGMWAALRERSDGA